MVQISKNIQESVIVAVKIKEDSCIEKMTGAVYAMGKAVKILFGFKDIILFYRKKKVEEERIAEKTEGENLQLLDKM